VIHAARGCQRLADRSSARQAEHSLRDDVALHLEAARLSTTSE
jgi:hypothetical protein